MNKLANFLVSAFKWALCGGMLLYFGGVMIIAPEASISYLMGFILLVVVLPTIFVCFFKDGLVARNIGFARFWKYGRFVFWGMWVLFIAFNVFVVWMSADENKTAAALDKIENTKLLLADVNGTNLPPAPNREENDATLAGIDANKNGIRDDVELAIFAKYPKSARVRAAELQYAQALQLELTEVFNSGTFVAVLKKRSSARSCIDDVGPEISLKSTSAEIKAGLAINKERKGEVDSWVVNTEKRRVKKSENLQYMTTYSVGADQKDCDIDPSSL